MPYLRGPPELTYPGFPVSPGKYQIFVVAQLPYQSIHLIASCLILFSTYHAVYLNAILSQQCSFNSLNGIGLEKIAKNFLKNFF